MSKKIVFASLALSTLLAANSASAGNTFGVGVEGFQERYKISDLDLDNSGNYGSITGFYQRTGNKYFTAIDGRVSHGSTDFESNNSTGRDEYPSGKVSGIPEWEFELRGRFGITMPLWGGSFSPYTGLGVRYQNEEGHGYLTDTGYQTYDTRTLQAYIPIGASMAFETNDGWHISPQLEVDISPYGTVDKRLTNINPFLSPNGAQYFNTSDTKQQFGYGARGELMFGKAMEGYSWQVGPFVRYWKFSDSDSTVYHDVVNPNQLYYVKEPSNERTQIGITARVLW